GLCFKLSFRFEPVLDIVTLCRSSSKEQFVCSSRNVIFSYFTVIRSNELEAFVFRCAFDIQFLLRLIVGRMGESRSVPLRFRRLTESRRLLAWVTDTPDPNRCGCVTRDGTQAGSMYGVVAMKFCDVSVRILL